MIAGKTICLCMIVRDESQVIERCLESVRDVIDHWVISDTGSLDGTQNMIRRALRGIPGTLMERPWQTFAHNRNEVLEAARGTADYLLLLDADEALEILEQPAELNGPGFQIIRQTGAFDYSVPLLIAGDVDWKYEGNVHEFIVPRIDLPWVPLPQIRVQHHADGAREESRLEQNLELIEADLEADPDNPRTVFYMAQTLREMGDFEEAIDYYRRRLELGGWDEELYYAHWQLGCLVRTLDWRAGLVDLLAAWDRRPSRPEALYDAVVLCRDQELRQLGFTLSARGLEIPPSQDTLFVHTSVEEWGMKFEHAIAAYWVGEHELAIRLNDELVHVPSLPAEVAAQIRINREYSVTALVELGRPVPARPMATASDGTA